MGQEILYCFKCQERITSGDLDSSNALRFGNRVSCKKCIPDLVITLSPEEQKELVARVQTPASDTRNRLVFTPRPRPAAPSNPSTRRTTKASPAAWIAIAVVGGAVLLGVIVYAMSDGRGSIDPRHIPGPLRPAPRPPEESPRERTAREALARAKAVSSSNLDGQIAAFAEALKVTEGTAHHRETKEMHEGLLEMRRKAFVRELGAVDERARVTLQREEFGAALAIYEAIRPLHAEPEWKSLVEAKVGDVRKAVDLAYAPLKEQAAQARGKGAEDEVKRLRERVSRWGLAEKTADLDAHLQGIALPPPTEVDARPWTPLFDGRTLDFLTGNGEGCWIVENGAIVHVRGKNNSAQTKRTYSNGELRARFEHRGLGDLQFGVRQGAEGSVGVAFNKLQLAPLEGSEHEVIIVFKGTEVTGTLDGKPVPMQIYGKNPLHGHIQFNGRGESCIIKSLEYRGDSLCEGLAGWWTLDALKGETAPDSSGNNNAGKVLEVPSPVPGRIGSAIQLDGRKSHVVVPASPSLDLTGPFTIAIWVKPKAENRNRGLVEKWMPDARGSSDLTTGYFLRLNQSGNVQFIIPATGDPDPEVRTPAAVAPDVWSHVAAVFDGTSMKVYINGKLSKSVSSSVAPRSDGSVLKIGMGGGGGPHHFSGEMDDVRLYNRALTPDEIARLAK